MRKKIGYLCIALGIACLIGAVGIVLYNRSEADMAAQLSQTLLEDVQQLIAEKKPQEGDNQESEKDPVAPEDPIANAPKEMATVKTGSYDCIGILSIPVLKLELPVLTDWSYAKLKKAPCLYYGSYYDKDFVIAAHNYWSHFGRLSQLQPGDVVIFTDVNGNAYYYEVVLLETLQKEATEEMITSGFALSLYTCTPGGGSRVTVRCKAKA